MKENFSIISLVEEGNYKNKFIKSLGEGWLHNAIEIKKTSLKKKKSFLTPKKS